MFKSIRLLAEILRELKGLNATLNSVRSLQIEIRDELQDFNAGMNEIHAILKISIEPTLDAIRDAR
jgi:hypothetical protein